MFNTMGNHINVNYNCGCGKPKCGGQCDCNTGGCPIKLDTSCIIYHKFGNIVSGLVNLGLPNGSTLQLILDTIDQKLGPLNMTGWTLPCLRSEYIINTLQEFGEAVDSELCLLSDMIADFSAATIVPLVANDSATIAFATSGPLDHILTGSVKISTTVGNRIGAVGDGLYTAPQTLTVSNANKTIGISGGNTVSLAGILCAPGGFLGNVTADPSPGDLVDGQYWFRTDTDSLHMRLNGTNREITII